MLDHRESLVRQEWACHSSCCNHSSRVNQLVLNLIACEICGSASLLRPGRLWPQTLAEVSVVFPIHRHRHHQRPLCQHISTLQTLVTSLKAGWGKSVCQKRAKKRGKYTVSLCTWLWFLQILLLKYSLSCCSVCVCVGETCLPGCHAQLSTTQHTTTSCIS